MTCNYQDLRSSHPLQACWDLQLGGLGGKVTIAGGIGVNGTIGATALGGSATAIRLGSGASTPLLHVTGTVNATGTGVANTTATGVAIDAGADASGFPAGLWARYSLAALQAEPPQWLQDLRKNGPHPKNLVAARLGGARLIDNVGVTVGGVAALEEEIAWTNATTTTTEGR